MRSAFWPRWATCALAIAIWVPALADRRKSLDDCTTFDQAEKEDDKLVLTVKSSCTVPIDCSVSWRVVCAPDSRKRRAVHASAAKFSLTRGDAKSTEVSAAICGDDPWTIDEVSWGCTPSKE